MNKYGLFISILIHTLFFLFIIFDFKFNNNNHNELRSIDIDMVSMPHPKQKKINLKKEQKQQPIIEEKPPQKIIEEKKQAIKKEEIKKTSIFGDSHIEKKAPPPKKEEVIKKEEEKKPDIKSNNPVKKDPPQKKGTKKEEKKPDIKKNNNTKKPNITEKSNAIKTETKNQPKEDIMDSLFKDLEKETRSYGIKILGKNGLSKNTIIATEKIQQHWHIPLGLRGLNKSEAHLLLKVSFNIHGEIKYIELKEKVCPSNLCQALIESSERAIKKAAPYTELSPEDFHEWKELNISFVPNG